MPSLADYSQILRCKAQPPSVMTEKHLSSQFDSELNTVSSRVMELGGMVESAAVEEVSASA